MKFANIIWCLLVISIDQLTLGRHIPKTTDKGADCQNWIICVKNIDPLSHGHKNEMNRNSNAKPSGRIERRRLMNDINGESEENKKKVMITEEMGVIDMELETMLDFGSNENVEIANNEPNNIPSFSVNTEATEAAKILNSEPHNEEIGETGKTTKSVPYESQTDGIEVNKVNKNIKVESSMEQTEKTKTYTVDNSVLSDKQHKPIIEKETTKVIQNIHVTPFKEQTDALETDVVENVNKESSLEPTLDTETSKGLKNVNSAIDCVPVSEIKITNLTPVTDVIPLEKLADALESSKKPTLDLETSQTSKDELEIGEVTKQTNVEQTDEVVQIINTESSLDPGKLMETKMWIENTDASPRPNSNEEELKKNN